ncbi:MAG: LuxR C-terminal-related transcriptional regulator [Marinibacterium sp.]
MAQGQTSKEIARSLSISPKTVEFHRHNLLQKFKASNMADLVHRSAAILPANSTQADET